MSSCQTTFIRQFFVFLDGHSTARANCEVTLAIECRKNKMTADHGNETNVTKSVECLQHWSNVFIWNGSPLLYNEGNPNF